MTKNNVMASCISPGRDCDLCPRLVTFRHESREKYPDKFNAPVPSFGVDDPALLVVGLAPGLKGANFSGRPFTGDYAGDLLYPGLLKAGFATGTYGRDPNDGLKLVNARITNAVRCVPPENKPTTEEKAQCLPFLEKEISSFKNLRVVLTLGLVAHNSVLKAFGLTAASCKFTHGKAHALTPKKTLDYPVLLLNTYHTSRYNVNTGRLTMDMFMDVMYQARDLALQERAA